MDSELLDGEDSRDRQKQKWSDNKNKVYSRKGLNPKSIKHFVESSNNLVATTEHNILSQPRVVSHPDTVAASDDSSSRNPVLPKVRGSWSDNSILGYVKYDNYVKISVHKLSKNDIELIKRKLMRELDQVRMLIKKLESKENQTRGYGAEGCMNSQFSANGGVGKVGGLMRVNSEVGSVGGPTSRPFAGLSLSMADSNNGVGSEILDKDKRTPKSNRLYQNSDFIGGKEKILPGESHKKMKKTVGGTSNMGMEFGPDKVLGQLSKNCNNLLTKLMKHKYGWVFNKPVDTKGLGLHDYFTIIKHPMDLGTVKGRLNKNWYKSAREFAEDVRLTFNNAMLYNPKGQDVHIMANTLLKIFEEKWAVIEREHNDDRRYDKAMPKSMSKKASTPSSVVPPAMPIHHEMRTVDKPESMPSPVDSRSKPTNASHPNRTPIPNKEKEQEPQKRPMTYEEKQKLSDNLQNLPSEKLEDIVQIIKKRNPHLNQQEDEIEIDIDNVDPETLWELDSFVSNHLRSPNKTKRKAEVAFQDCDEGHHAAPKTHNSVSTMAEAPKENVEVEKQVHVGSGSSGSSSSSSDSESSSSDSDSERSSS